MSFQRHFKRNEIWLVSEGSCLVYFTEDKTTKDKSKLKLQKFDHYLVSKKDWHQIKNPHKETCHVIEIQYGDECIEEDIERRC